MHRRSIQIGDVVLRLDARHVRGEVVALSAGRANVQWSRNTRAWANLSALVPVRGRTSRRRSFAAAALWLLLLTVPFLHGQTVAIQPTRQGLPNAQANPTDAPPLTYSQNTAFFQLDARIYEINQRREALKRQLWELDGLLYSGVEAERAVAEEYAQQHPGWHLDDKHNPAKDAPAGATVKPKK